MMRRAWCLSTLLLVLGAATASLSCPDLRREPYVAARLDAQLVQATRAFLANPAKGVAPGPEGRTARVSAIFKWFAGDWSLNDARRAGPP
jgi:hypothetical protein